MELSRRTFLGTSAVAAGAAISSAYAAGGKPRPNIVFIFSDDHAYQAIGAYGGRLKNTAPTPNIDRIAKEGVLFTNCCVTNSICGPSRAVILTGKHSHLNGFYKNQREPFDGSQTTFPKLLRQAGYQTAIVGKWHLRSEPTGFDHWEVLPGQGHYYGPEFITPAGRRAETGYVTDLITDKALTWLEETRDPAEPFCLMVQHKAPHREWMPGPDHLTLFDDEDIPEPATLFDDYEGRGTAAREQDMTIAETMRLGADLKVRGGQGTDRLEAWLDRMTPEQRAKWNAAYEPKNEAFRTAQLEGNDLVRWKYQRYMKDYLRCIASIDDNVGRILDYLDASGLADNTVVVYSSDQGFYLGEHGWFDKRFMYEESFRMPLVARWPGHAPPNTVNDAMVSNLDFAETFLDLAGAAIPSEMQGRSLVPLLKGDTPDDWRESVYYHYYGYPAVHSVRRHEGAATKRFKLLHFYNLGEWELYDLKTDPLELHSVHDDPAYAQVLESMKLELERLRAYYKVPPNDQAPA
jgi:arylsulfatase A-like enzyme